MDVWFPSTSLAWPHGSINQIAINLNSMKSLSIILFKKRNEGAAAVGDPLTSAKYVT